MSHALDLLLAQINTSVGAVEKNALKISEIIKTNQHNHDLIIFPELALTGYPPKDLLFRPELFHRVEAALKEITEITKDCYVILGHPSVENGLRYNAASVLHKGSRVNLYYKQRLPNYGVFDEMRYFTPGDKHPCVFDVNGYRIGLCICEDLWGNGPIEDLLEYKSELIIVINASPFEQDKYLQRETLLKSVSRLNTSLVYLNQVGGQDELVFDGQSLAINCSGEPAARLMAFKEDIQSIRFENHQFTGPITPYLSPMALLYEALCCGLQDYVRKNSFSDVLLGLSGGIDSALTLAIAVDTLGASRVHTVMMPSQYTSEASLEDAQNQAERLSVEYLVLPIEPTYQACLATLADAFSGKNPDKTEENIQARTRGLLLMALSNKNNYLLLTTGNKSEIAVGYATLYGDMCGGFSVLKDIFKTKVYELARYRNSISSVIPERVLTRPPTAELAPNQTDQDTLPDYVTLDAIVKAYMSCQSEADIVCQGYPLDTVKQVISLIKHNEYKRQQAAPGIKVSQCSFGLDWRYPITSKF